MFISFSCVPTRQFQELKMKNKDTVHERDSLKDHNEYLTVQYTECEAELEELRKRLDKLVSEQMLLKDSARIYKKQYKVFKTMYDDLANERNLAQSAQDQETMQLLAELQVTRNDLLEQEDDLRALEESLLQKQLELEERDKVLLALDASLNKQRNELETKSKRVMELEGILQRKDSAVAALKNKITDALIGFQDKGLTIEQKHGKVYVTMDEKLLFKSGRWDVDPNGQAAINKLGKVLEANKDINVTVEGHTDNVPMNGSGDIKDNWDLSVKRATSITKILLSGSNIEPIRVTASGKGPYMPVDPANTPEARAKNRRTEIILVPKLDELFRILEAN